MQGSEVIRLRFRKNFVIVNANEMVGLWCGGGSDTEKLTLEKSLVKLLQYFR